LVGLSAPVWAQRGGAGRLNIVRDTEIENDIRTLGTPIWRAAGLDPADMEIYLVADDQLNSFVAGGQAIFLNTGLIEKAQTPDQLIGVLAHETGHIVGGHVILSKEAMHNAGIESLLAMAAGAAAAALGGNGAPLLAASGVGERSFLRFSVAQEATADHAALNFLDRACLSARGLLQFFEILQSNEMLSGEREQQWGRTHPLTASRIQYVREHVERARCSNAPDRPGSAALLKTIQAKLHGFLDPPQATLAAYPATDTSPLARYARAIAYYRIPDLAHALPAIDGLIRDFPDNPYYRELKGQMLFENGHVREAVAPYEAAVRLLPSAPLLRISLSQVYIETGDRALNRRAIANLKDASRQESHDSQLWHFLAVAYGRDGQMGEAALALAEEALAGGKQKEATREAARAEHLLQRSSDGYSRAIEITREAKDLDE
ncbi:MAG TPA: M48 family metalloprotease, partial [Stellaceae bacterium]|nr:M48 family metalloprotease [Stellaceae bacterium]